MPGLKRDVRPTKLGKLLNKQLDSEEKGMRFAQQPDFDERIAASREERRLKLKGRFHKSTLKNPEMQLKCYEARMAKYHNRVKELDARQRRAILMLSDPMHDYTKRYIALACGVTPAVIWQWRNDPLFIRELDKELTKRKTAFRTEAYRHLFRRIKQGRWGTIKDYFKMTGDLKNNITVEEVETHKNESELDKEIAELSSELGIEITNELQSTRG